MQKISQRLDNFFALEELAEKDTPVHRLHPMAKIAVTLTFIVCVISSNRYDVAGLTIFCFYPAIIISLAELSFQDVLFRTLPALPFVLFAGISNIIFENTLAPVGVSYGVLSCVVLVEKTLLAVSAVIILVSTTRAKLLLAQLQRLHVPRIFTTTVMLCFRYLSLLVSEAGNMTRAYHLRSVKQRGLEMKHLGAFVGQLLLRSIDRAERVYAAMKCRGFDGSFPVSGPEKPDTASVIYAVGISFVLITLRLIDISGVFSALGKLL